MKRIALALIQKSKVSNLKSKMPSPGSTAAQCTVTARYFCFLLLPFALLSEAPAQQTVTVAAQPVRVTVADSSTSSTVITNLVTIAGGSNTVNLGISGLPAGVGASFDQTTFTETGGANLTVNTTNVASGEHILSIDATGGAENHFLLTLQSGRMWTGATNVAGNWSAGGSWVGGVPPGPSDDVLFTGLGAQASNFTNSIVDADTSIASLRFSQADAGTPFHTLQINSNRTLAITGDKGLRLLRDNTDAGSGMTVAFTGPQGRLVVSNTNANIGFVIGNQVTHTNNMSGLGTFVADVNRIGFGDYRLFPNYTNLVANGFGGGLPFLIPRRFIPTVILARTNIIRASHADTNNYMDPGIRDYSLTLGNNDVGTTADCTLWLGVSNAFFLDSICLIQSSAQGDVAAGSVVFNPAFTALNPVAYFRGTNGGRMSVFAISDAAGPGASGTGDKAIVNLAGGIVDALVDRLYLARDRTNSSDGATAEATLTLGRGVFDVNTAILGFQGQGNNQNVGGADQRSYARGTLNVSNTLFIVNDTLELGHTTADAGHPSQAESGFGQLTVLNGGTVRANTITVGGMTKLSGANTITLTNSANLVVTNTIAAADKKLAALTMISSMLTLNVDGTNTSPYVYVTNLIAGGAGNVIRLASVTGVSSYPAQLALIGYESAAAGFSVIVPSGLFGYIVNNTANKTIDVILATNAPKTVVWRGNIDGNWNTTTLNWVDPLTLTATNFSQGDFVVFDDTATGATNISIIDSVVSGQHATLPGVLVSNSVRNYTFTGGTIAGTGKMLKQGSGTLSVDANSENSLTVSNGTVNVTAGGTVGSTTVAAGTAFTSSGTVNGLTSASFSSSAGTINGPVAIQAGTFVNSGTVDTTPGTMTIGAGALITNLSSGVLNVRVPTGNNWAVPTNAVLANFGRINNLSQRLNMNAGSLLYGIGVVGRGAGVTVDNGRLAINAGAVFSPGETPFHSLGVFTVEARLDVNQAGGGNPAGRLVIEIDMGHPMTNDVVAVDKWSNIRGTIVMTNIGTIPFAAGQSFHIVSNNFGFPNTPEVANLDYTIEPVVPGLGLAWDTSNLITNGVLSIKTLPSTSTNIMVSITTNLWELAWPAEYRGWRLQGQTNNIAIGISNNWGTVPNSHLTNRVFMRMNPANGAVFWRLIHP